jgi:hypothetical protein
MLDDLSSILTILRLALLLIGVGALTVWASREADRDSVILKRLTERHSKCADDVQDALNGRRASNGKT